MHCGTTTGAHDSGCIHLEHTMLGHGRIHAINLVLIKFMAIQPADDKHVLQIINAPLVAMHMPMASVEWQSSTPLSCTCIVSVVLQDH